MQTKATALFKQTLSDYMYRKKKNISTVPSQQNLDCNQMAIYSQVVLLNWKFASHMVSHDHNELTQGKVNISYLLHYYSGLNEKKNNEKHLFKKKTDQEPIYPM